MQMIRPVSRYTKYVYFKRISYIIPNLLINHLIPQDGRFGCVPAILQVTSTQGSLSVI